MDKRYYEEQWIKLEELTANIIKLMDEIQKDRNEIHKIIDALKEECDVDE